MRVIKEIPVGQIKINRTPIEPRTLRYALAMQDGSEFPPIKVAKTNCGYEIRDGRHRCTASKLIGKEMILAKFSTTKLKGR